MRNILACFEKVQSFIQQIFRVEIERYEEQVLSKDRGNLRIHLRFFDNSLLEINEAIHIKEEMLEWLSYRYHYQKAKGSIIFRYDNTPHHHELKTYPDHKHIGDFVVEAVRPNIEEVLDEVKRNVTF